jgi:predicted Na+-dependent transporter
MAVVSPACVAAGVLLAPWIGKWHGVVPWVFALMTFQSALGCGWRDVGNAFRRPGPVLAVLAALHVAMPALALGVGWALFRGEPEIVAGIVLEFAIPTGIISLVWIGIAGGDAALGLSVVLLDTLLAPVVVPAVLVAALRAVGAEGSVRIDGAMAWALLRGLAFMVALPAAAAVGVNQATGGRVKETWMKWLSPWTKLGFIVVITLNATGLRAYAERPSWLLAGVVATMGVLAVVGLLAGVAAALSVRAGPEERATMILDTGLRNISAGATIAAAYFPGQAVLLPVMAATLFQQVTTAFVGLPLIRRVKRMRVRR